jgi:uncharacterized Tic20 family protein
MATDPTPAPPATPPAAPTDSTEEERNISMLTHLGGVFTGFIAPLIIWQVKKDQSAFITEQAKEALNWQITLHIADVPIWIIILFIHPGIGIFLWLPVIIARLIFGIMGSMAASEGKHFRYLYSLRLVQ